MFLARFNHYAVSFAIAVLGLSGCSTPRKSSKAAQITRIEPVSSSITEHDQDSSQAGPQLPTP